MFINFLKTTRGSTTLILIILVLVGYAWFLALKNQEFRTFIEYICEDAFMRNVDRDLMLGSSSILRLNPREHLNCGIWLNRGIGNSTISSLKRYLTISPLSIVPSKILLYAGENDISQGSTVTRTIKEYKNLLLYILNKYPGSELHVIAIKPSPARRVFWDKFREVNEALEKYLSRIKRAYFHVPKWNALTHGKLTKFTNDGVHLTKHGYKFFTSGINRLCRNH